MSHWQNQINMEDETFVTALRSWIERADYGHAGFVMLRKAVCSRIAKRQTPHGPGKKKRSPRFGNHHYVIRFLFERKQKRMATFKVHAGVESFCIEDPSGNESPMAQWGEVAAIVYNGEVYICTGDDEKEDQVVEMVVTTDTRPITVETVQCVFEGETEASDDEGEDDGENDGDEDDGEEMPGGGPELVEEEV